MHTKYTHLVSYLGNVYHWGTVIASHGRRGYRRFALISPVGGGDEIAVPVTKLKRLPGPGLITTYAYAGT